MNRKRVTVATVLIGISMLIAGGLRVHSANRHQQIAAGFLALQLKTHETLHRESDSVGNRFRAGEMDEAGWHREIAVVSDRFKTTSEAAGLSWLNEVSLASQYNRQGGNFFLCGVFCLATAAFLMFRSGGSGRLSGTESDRKRHV